MDNNVGHSLYVFETLPKEIISKIITLSDSPIEYFCSLSKVSKSISETLRQLRSFWNEVRLESKCAKVLTQIFSGQDRMCCIRVLDLHTIKNIDYKFIELISKCRALERLSLRYSNSVDIKDFKYYNSNLEPTDLNDSSSIDDDPMKNTSIETKLTMIQSSPNPIIQSNLFSSNVSFPVMAPNMSSLIKKDSEKEISMDKIYWPNSLKIINFTNTKLYYINDIVVNNLSKLYLSGMLNPIDELMEFIMNNKDTLEELDVSRTLLKPENITHILDNCRNLKLLAATEIMQAGYEVIYKRKYPNICLLFDLLGHSEEAIKLRESSLKSLYNVDGEGCSLLADAIHVGIQHNIIKKMVEMWHLDPNISASLPSPWVCPYPMKYQSHPGRYVNAIHEAISKHKLEIIQFLLDIGADPKKPCPEKNNESPIALMFSLNNASENCIDICELLIKSGSDVMQIDNNGENAFDMAFKQTKNITVITSLVQRNVFTIVQLNDLLIRAVQVGSLNLFRECLNHGAEIMTLNKMGQNCLNIALANSDINMVKEILSSIPKMHIETLINMKTPPLGWTSMQYALRINDESRKRTVINWIIQKEITDS